MKLTAALVFSPHRTQHRLLGTTRKELALDVLLGQLALENKVEPLHPDKLVQWTVPRRLCRTVG